MGQKYERFRELQTPLSLRDIHKNSRSMYACVPLAMAQFVLKIEKLSHIMGPTPILEMACAYSLRPRLWLLVVCITVKINHNLHSIYNCYNLCGVICRLEVTISIDYICSNILHFRVMIQFTTFQRKFRI